MIKESEPLSRNELKALIDSRQSQIPLSKIQDKDDNQEINSILWGMSYLFNQHKLKTINLEEQMERETRALSRESKRTNQMFRGYINPMKIDTQEPKGYTKFICKKFNEEVCGLFKHLIIMFLLYYFSSSHISGVQIN